MGKLVPLLTPLAANRLLHGHYSSADRTLLIGISNLAVEQPPSPAAEPMDLDNKHDLPAPSESVPGLVPASAGEDIVPVESVSIEIAENRGSTEPTNPTETASVEPRETIKLSMTGTNGDSLALAQIESERSSDLASQGQANDSVEALPETFSTQPPQEVVTQSELAPSDSAPITDPSASVDEGTDITSIPPTADPAVDISTVPAQPIDKYSTTKVAREREEDEAEEGPTSKRAKTGDLPTDDTSVSQPTASAPSSTTQPVSADSQVMQDLQTSPVREEWGDLTDTQSKRLLEGMRNLKKGKHAGHFSKPVDPVALNLPNYINIVKTPMDLSTMEQKLKENRYSSVADYIADFNLMVMNAITFNGQQHTVAQAGMMLRSQFNAQLKKVPKVGDPSPPEANQKAKRASLPGPTREAPKRESRPSFGANPSPITPFAPDPNGVPLARRDSSAMDRPKRKIQRPAPRDLTYPKTQKKKYKAELKFADEVLTEMERPRYQSYSHPFLEPVDPVAMNIPNYHQVIKKPMDVSTIRQKLNEQQYENLKEFESDFRLMFKNCYKFNPDTHPVHTQGRQYEDIFNQEMAKKNERIKALAPPSARESSQEEEDEEEEEEEEDEETEQQKKLRQLNEQLAALSEQAAKLMQDGAANKKTKGKKEKGKAVRPESKKKKPASANAAAPRAEKKPKPKTSKPKSKPVTQKEKEEISSRILELPVEDINEVGEKIKKSMRDRGIPVSDDSELEFNIDDIPEDILRNILQRLRRNQSGTSTVKNEDDDYEESAQNYAPKGKRNKPMSQADTQHQMAAIQKQINSFAGDNNGESLSCVLNQCNR